MIEERFESYVYQIMQYVKYQENKPYIESILEEMRYTLFREDREYIKELEKRIDKAIEYIKEHNIIGVNKEYLPSGIEKCYSVELLEILQNGIEEQEQSKIKFLLNGCDISFYATAPEDITLKQLLKQCDRIKPNYCACGLCSEEFRDEDVELIIDYDDIRKANDDVSCEILGDKE